MTLQNSFSRRRFLGQSTLAGAGAAASVMSLDILKSEAFSKQLKQNGKRVLLLWLAGGVSQLETFDPKPGRLTGGPFQAIQTKIGFILMNLGIQFSSYLIILLVDPTL